MVQTGKPAYLSEVCYVNDVADTLGSQLIDEVRILAQSPEDDLGGT